MNNAQNALKQALVMGKKDPAKEKPKAAITTSNKGFTNAELSEIYKIPVSTIEKWVTKLNKGESLDNIRNPIAKQLTRIDNLWFVADQ